MNSGADDVQFLKDVNTYLIATYGVIGRTLVGHSAGGFMVQRMWIESGSTYGHYCSASGCVPYSLRNAAMPGTVRPIHMQVGNDDPILAVLDSVGANHFFDDTYTQVLTNVNRAGYNFPLQSVRVSFWRTLVDRALAVSAETVVAGDGVDTTMTGNGQTMTTWTYNSGAFVLRRLAGVGHDISEQNTAMGHNIFNQWMAFVIST
jgi:poly(3-hydroxybutyrate) depolymerase